jgi:hypothetical protein
MSRIIGPNLFSVCHFLAEQLRNRPGDDADEDERDDQEGELVHVVMAERDQARGDAEGDAAEPRRDEAARGVGEREPSREQRQRIGGVTAG